MLVAAIACFALAALLGLFLLSYVLRSKPTPKGIALVHGALAAVGLLLLVIAWASDRPTPLLSLGLFTAAAAGGFLLLFLDLTRGRVPKLVAVAHGALAATALVMLVMFVAKG